MRPSPLKLSPLNQRRWRNFKANRRALWSLFIFAVLFGATLAVLITRSLVRPIETAVVASQVESKP